MKLLYLSASAFMKLLTSVVILHTIYSNISNPSYPYNWIIFFLTVIWAFYPIYEYSITTEYNKINIRNLKGGEKNE